MAAQSDDKKLAYKRFREALDWNPYFEEVRAVAEELRARFEGQEI
ncbi:MAG: hypothetical protein AAF723_10925 [Pseudomonadota bacterium]